MDLNNPQTLFIISLSALILLLVFYNGFGFKLKHGIKSLTHKIQNQEANIQPIKIEKFTIAIHIPDVKDKYQEGGFHLYFESPELHIKRLLTYQFDKNSIVKETFNLDHRHITIEQFEKAMPKMMIYSNSKNVFNTDLVMIGALLSNGNFVSCQKEIDSTIDHNHQTPPIMFNHMKLN